MPRVVRHLILSGVALGLLALLATLAAGAWLSWWIPTHGKAWCESQLSERLSLRVTIERLTYGPRRGLVVEELRASDPATHVEWWRAPRLTAHLSLLELLLRQRLAFQMDGTLIAPCATAITASGHYHLRTKQAFVALQTTAIAIECIAAPLVQRLPPALKAGVVQPVLHVTWQAGTPPQITGTITGTDLVWAREAWRATGDVILEGMLVPTPQQHQPLSLRADITVTRGTLEGLAAVGPVTNITGTLRVRDDALELSGVQATAMGLPWHMDGTITGLDTPYADLVIRTQLDVATFATRLPQTLSSWQPQGAVETTAICRGFLKQWPFVEVLARGMVRNASLLLPTFPHRLEQLAGEIRYDHLAKRIEIVSMSGRVSDAPLMVHGALRLTTPVEWALTTETQASLDLLQPLLPPHHPVQSATGRADVHLELTGTSAQPRWQALVILHDARMLVRPLTDPIEALSGTLRLTNEELSTEALSFRIREQPVRLAGSVTALTTTPRVVVHAQLAAGWADLQGVWHPGRFSIESGEVTFGQSKLQLTGQLSRVANQPSRMRINSVVELSDLKTLPWMDLRALKNWQLAGGVTTQLRLEGALDDWSGMTMQGIARADALSMNGVPVRAVSLELEQAQRRLAVRLTNAMVADGRVVGKWLLEWEPAPSRYLLECDLTRLDLAQLASSIPAWRQRQIRGLASAHASWLGVWKDSQSLRGDGWLHATGEQLGEFPLLDRLMRGLFGVLADRLGLSTLRTTQLTAIAGTYRLSNGRLITEDLKLTGMAGTEPITIALRGSVGLDKTLDLIVEPEFSEQLVLQAPNTSTLAGTIVKTVGGLERLRRLVGRHHVSGTLEKPHYKFEVSLDQALNQLLPVGVEQLFESLR